VELTSGGSGGPSLDERYCGLPNNFYAHLDRPTPLADIAEAFHGIGWSVRKAAWDEYEVSNTWAELNLSAEGLIAGLVAPNGRDRMIELLTELGHPCTADPEEPIAT
jgi:hypothetical protein